MKIKPYIEKLEKSQAYKDFRVKYPSAFMVAGFFVLDLESGQNVHQIDFYVPSEKKFAAFSLDGGAVEMKLVEAIGGHVPEQMDMETNVDLDALTGILADEMHNRGMSEDIKKIIAVVQNIDGKKIWNLNCVLSGMEILNSHIEDDSGTVLKIEKKSFVDIMKKMPQPAEMPKMGEKDDVKGELDKLDKVKGELEKEKAFLKEKLEAEKGEKEK